MLIFRSELTLMLRRSQEWLYPLVFFLIVLSLFPLAFSPDPAFLRKYVPGCVWIAALLASLLSSEHLFASDTEDGYLEQLILSPTSLTLSISAKLAAKWLATQLPLILLIPVVGQAFQLMPGTTGVLMLSLLLGTPILTLINALGVSLTLGLGQPGIFLGLLILPLTTPVLIFGVSIIQQYQANFSIAGPLALLSALCIVAVMFLPAAIAATVRISVDD